MFEHFVYEMVAQMVHKHSLKQEQNLEALQTEIE
jgi:hypothetical protein